MGVVRKECKQEGQRGWNLESGLLWKSILGEIELKVSPSIFATWFKKTRLLSHGPSGLVIGVPNIFAQRQLETQFKPLLQKTLAKNEISLTQVQYRILSSTAVSVPIDNSEAAPAASRRLTNSSLWAQDYRRGLNSRYTFENFIPGPGNDLAYAAAKAVVETLGGKYNPLFVYGGVGIGKTHLVQAIGNEVASQRSRLKVAYLTIEQFVQEFTDAIRHKKISEFTNSYRKTDVLIIDDIQFIANKERTQEEFFHTFNVLYEAGKQIIVSSDQPPHALPTLEERLKSRFQMGMVIDMQIPDFETRCAILKFKAEEMALKMDDECVEYLAGSISANIRILEGALNQLGIFCETHQVNLATAQLARRALGQRLQRMPARLTAKQIIEKTARYFQTNPEEMLGPKRHKEVVLPRQIAMYLMRRELHASFPSIARCLGRKDHTTAIHSFKKIHKQANYDEDLRRDIYEIKRSLNI